MKIRWKEGNKEGSMDGLWLEEWKGGRVKEWTVRRMERWKNRRMEGERDGRKEECTDRKMSGR